MEEFQEFVLEKLNQVFSEDEIIQNKIILIKAYQCGLIDNINNKYGIA